MEGGKPLLVGLTGGLGAGKSTVAGMLREAGLPVIDTDEVAHRLLGDRNGQVFARVMAQFGPQISAADGGIDRAALAAIVFSEAERRKALESILHPAIRAVVEEKAAQLAPQHSVIVLEVPLLFEAKWDRWVDMVVVVDAPEETQAARFAAKTGASLDEARRRMGQQLDRQERLRHAHYTLDNSAAVDALRPKVERLVRLLKEAARRKQAVQP
jgi:dephospho-CoA kinase